MDAAIKGRWYDWLHENKDKQGKGRLNIDNEKFCCLGGLCELAVKAGVIGPPVLKATAPDGLDGVEVFGYGGEVDEVLLPEEVVEWAGLNYATPIVDALVGLEGDDSDQVEPNVLVGEVPVGLTELNDDFGYTFPEIAELILEQL